MQGIVMVLVYGMVTTFPYINPRKIFFKKNCICKK